MQGGGKVLDDGRRKEKGRFHLEGELGVPESF